MAGKCWLKRAGLRIERACIHRLGCRQKDCEYRHIQSGAKMHCACIIGYKQARLEEQGAKLSQIRLADCIYKWIIATLGKAPCQLQFRASPKEQGSKALFLP